MRLLLPPATPHDVVKWRAFRGQKVFIPYSKPTPGVTKDFTRLTCTCAFTRRWDCIARKQSVTQVV